MSEAALAPVREGLRLCLAGPYPRTPESIGGGVEYVVYVLAETLAERGDLVLDVVTPVKGMRGTEVVRRGGATLHFVGVPERRFVPNLLAQAGPVARVIRDLAPDVVNSHHIATTAAAVRAGARVVHVIHGIARRELSYKARRAHLAGWLQAEMDRAWIGRADAVASVCRYGLEQFPSLTRRGVVVWNPVEDLFFDVPAMVPSKQVLYVGALTRLKNILALLAALPRVLAEEPDFVLRVYGGTGDAEYTAKIKELIAREQLGNAVRFEGIVGRDALARALEGSAGLVLPSLQEAAPVVLSQTMAAGRVALAAAVGGVPELIEHGRTGILFDPADTAVLARHLLELVRDLPRARAIGEAAREVARARHERHGVAKRMLALCRSVAAPPRELRRAGGAP